MIAIIAGAAAALVLGVLLLLWWRRKVRSKPENLVLETSLKQSLTPSMVEEGSSNYEGSTSVVVPQRPYRGAEVVKKLGRGSSGDVFLVRLDGGAGNTPLAVCKRCSFDEELSDEQKHELYNEIRILSSLCHEHIVRYLHSERQGAELCIYMEYCEGGTLAQAIRKRAGRPFDTAQVLRWLKQLASALSYVHDDCVLHRDLKTANVFLSAGGDIKLGDFGLSRALSTYTHFASTIVGTPYYMAPEVIASESYAHPADCWALGVILFEMLTLRRPFDGEHLGSIVSRISRGEYDEAALRNAKDPHGAPLPASLVRLASRDGLLQPDPERRTRLEEVLQCVRELSPQAA